MLKKCSSDNKKPMQHLLQSAFQTMNRPNENNAIKVKEKCAIVYMPFF
jgi:hypothetical protein